MAVAILLTSMRVLAFVLPAAADNEPAWVVRDDALHFIIRHWHTDVDAETMYPGNNIPVDGYGNYFVLVEGYIMPQESTDDDTERFEFFLVEQSSGNLIKFGDGDREDEVIFTDSPYIVSVDEDNGVILLAEKPLMDGNDPMENFAGFSISAGQGAVSHINMESTDPDTGEVSVTKGIEIKYDPYTHLVKGHAFYTHASMIVDGVPTTTVSGGLDLPFDEANGVDTVQVYTYVRDVNTHKAGEIVMSDADHTQACMDKDDLPDGLKVGTDVQLSKFYSAVEGLHTDKSVVQTEDGRTFLANLQTWYVEGVASQVGLVLDASGSMIFTIDEPEQIKLTEEQLELLKKANLKQLTSQSDPNGTGDSWENYFLTDEVLNKILNPHNTDNSLLSSSGYSYYVKSSDGYEPLGYWEGVITYVDPSYQFKANGKDIMFGWPNAWHGPIADNPGSDGRYGLSGTVGFRTSGANASTAGLLLDATPTGGSFTISFDVIQSGGTDPVAAKRKLAELLYIGSLSGNTGDGGFYRLFRGAGNDSAYLKANDNTTAEGTLTNISGIFNSNGRYRITLVFDESTRTVTSYKNKELVGEAQPFSFADSSAIRIILNGIQDDYDGADLYIDDIYVFNGVLTASDLSNIVVVTDTTKTTAPAAWDGYGSLIGKYLFSNGNPAPSSTEAPENGRTWLKNDAPNAAVGESSVKTTSDLTGYASRKIREADRLLFSITDAPPTIAKTWAGDTLGSINLIGSDATGAAYYNHTQAGWYHISHAGRFTNHYELLGTGKRLLGVDGTKADFSVKDTLAGEGNNTNLDYAGGLGDTPTLFYVDAAGYLRCFYGSNGGCSYVYELSDIGYIRTEALQRVLGSFTTTLADRSPASQVSAVRFSTGDTDFDLSKLVLLDWTNDPNEMANLMSLTRGNGGAKGYDTSTTNGLKQYNYGLTGSTDTYSGLKAYYDYLRVNDYSHDSNDYNDEGAKYLIVFTDGNDTAADKQPALNIANELKKEGYVIFTVILSREDDATSTTKEFLPALAGRQGVTVDPTTGKGKEDGISYFFWTEDIDSLTNTFLSDILSHIAEPLQGYTVQDYIDPRFNLVERTSDGDILWKLQANGEVTLISKTSGKELGTINVTETDPATGKSYTIHLSGDTNPDARDPYLRFDQDADMYYLVWEDQDIPTSAIGANRMAVWNAQVILQAKDDFIGGNAILTNGNYAEMNWVYHPGDVKGADRTIYPNNPVQPYGGEDACGDASSGTSDWMKEYGTQPDPQDPSKTIRNTNDVKDAYPSKGIPRVTVNVALLPIYTNPINDVIFMGETVSPRLILMDIKGKYMTETYYLEYLKRYAYARYENFPSDSTQKEMDRPLLDLLTEWLEFENEKNPIKAFSIPYMYLPAVEWDDASGKIALDSQGKAMTVYNNTGRKDTNERDVVGVLTYRWEKLNPEPQYPYEPVEDYVKNDTDRVIYSLTVEFTPLRVGDEYETFYGSSGEDDPELGEATTTAQGDPIVIIAEDQDGEIKGVRAGKFAPYLRIDDPHKGTVEDDTRLDREKYVNGYLKEDGTIDPDGDHRKDYALIQDTAYRWNKIYKPAVGNEEVTVTDLTPDDEGYPYGSATVSEDGRTLSAFSRYTLDVVSGDIILELKLLIGELEEIGMVDGKPFTTSFTLDAIRNFTDTDLIQMIKGEARNKEWKDYGDKFTFTFTINLTEKDITKLRAEAEADPNGYVRVYAKATEVWTTFGKENEAEEDKKVNLVEDSANVGLPIGSYTFNLKDANTKIDLGSLKDLIHFESMEAEREDRRFRDAIDLFNKVVLRGLATTNEFPDLKYRNSAEVTVNDKTYTLVGWPQEIIKENVTDFVVPSDTSSGKDTVTFYLGTDKNDEEAHRGYVSEDPQDVNRYTYKRLGILRLSTGITKLTIVEKGGQSNESFIYRITGKTLGGKDVDLTVTVHGNDSTTVVIAPGDYTITEIHDWSWRYDNEDTHGKYAADGGPLDEKWTLYPDDLTKASTSLRYRDDLPENAGHETIEEHKTIIYEHTNADDVWLGGENHNDNQFK